MCPLGLNVCVNTRVFMLRPPEKYFLTSIYAVVQCTYTTHILWNKERCIITPHLYRMIWQQYKATGRKVQIYEVLHLKDFIFMSFMLSHVLVFVCVCERAKAKACENLIRHCMFDSWLDISSLTHTQSRYVVSSMLFRWFEKFTFTSK